MFTTSLAAATVAGLMASSTLVGQADWAPDYGRALALAAEQQKPVAVFLTQNGLTELTGGKGLGTDAMKALRTNYIAVRVDTTSDTGKKLAESFGIRDGVILSDRAGARIALRHEGAISPPDLSGYLTKYSTTTQAVTTEYRTTLAASPFVVPVQSYNPGVVQPIYAPVYQQPNRPVINAIQNFNTAVFGQPLLGGS